MRGEGSVRKIVGGLAHVAQVEVEVVESQVIQVKDRCDGDGWIRQGSIEDAPAEGYEAWKRAAALGARYALDSLGRTAEVTVERISGLATDTNATAVAIAAARGVWQALGVSAPDGIDEQLEELLRSAWEIDPEVAPMLAEGAGDVDARP